MSNTFSHLGQVSESSKSRTLHLSSPINCSWIISIFSVLLYTILYVVSPHSKHSLSSVETGKVWPEGLPICLPLTRVHPNHPSVLIHPQPNSLRAISALQLLHLKKKTNGIIYSRNPELIHFLSIVEKLIIFAEISNKMIFRRIFF